jgi:hypothetical protein
MCLICPTFAEKYLSALVDIVAMLSMGHLVYNPAHADPKEFAVEAAVGNLDGFNSPRLCFYHKDCPTVPVCFTLFGCVLQPSIATAIPMGL